jgi:hypothetical protein
VQRNLSGNRLEKSQRDTFSQPMIDWRRLVPSILDQKARGQKLFLRTTTSSPPRQRHDRERA